MIKSKRATIPSAVCSSESTSLYKHSNNKSIACFTYSTSIPTCEEKCNFKGTIKWFLIFRLPISSEVLRKTLTLLIFTKHLKAQNHWIFLRGEGNSYKPFLFCKLSDNERASAENWTPFLFCKLSDNERASAENWIPFLFCKLSDNERASAENWSQLWWCIYEVKKRSLVALCFWSKPEVEILRW